MDAHEHSAAKLLLHKRIEQHLDSSEPSTGDVDIVFKSLFEVVNDEPAKALAYSQRLVQIAETLNYTIGVAYAEGLIGYSYFLLSDFKEALPRMLNIAASLNENEEQYLSARLNLGISNIYLSLGMYTESLEHAQVAFTLAQRADSAEGIAWAHNALGMIYQVVEDHDKAIQQFNQSLVLFDGLSDGEESQIVGLGRIIGRGRALTGIGTSLTAMGKSADALQYHEEAYDLYVSANNANGQARALTDIALCMSSKEAKGASEMHLQSLEIRRRIGNRQAQCTSLIHLANLSRKSGDLDDALAYIDESLNLARTINSKPREFQSHEVLAEIYEDRGNWQLALDHLKQFHATKNSISGEDTRTQIASIQIARQAESARKDAEIARLTAETLNVKNVELTGLLKELRQTQAQLVQSEKLASLGQLTAGIAHEIRNPLNFVINFTAINFEIIQDLKDELDIDTHDRERVGLVTELISDLQTNSEKINEHGQRADRIVSNMLEHSRTSSGEKAEVDLNRLTNEYADLAYHGARAANPKFSASIEFDLDPTLRNVSIVGPDIGRVILNLVANACHAIQTKAEADPNDSFEGRISVSTSHSGDKAFIDIADNGGGVSEALRGQVFDPFFTTKPPGQGTGLGLSISHDIVAGGHSGNLELLNNSENGATFRVSLPVS